MWNDILSALWFFAPAGLANMTPVLVAKLPYLHKLNWPIDGGKTFRDKPIFGPNKTYRGFFFGFLIALLMVVWQKWAVDSGTWSDELAWIDYSTINVLVLAAAFSFGALGGDALESFVKRQLGIKAGQSWFPFDQLDYILGGLLLSGALVELKPSHVFMVLVVWFVIHPVSTVIGWSIGLKDKPI